LKKVKKTAIITIVFLFALITAGEIYSDTALTEEYQQDLFDRLNHLRGEGPRPASLENLERPICGTSVAFEAFINRDRLDGAYKISTVMQGRDTTLECSYESPDGHFLIHYDTTGVNAVYKPDLDTLAGGDGIPDYVNKVGEIADSVWTYVVDELGFPPPPRDDFYPAGLDSTYDIYIEGLGSAYYGATYSDMLVDSQSVTSVLVLDNNYNFPPYNEYDGDPRDLNRRLDAVRVTTAHEFFHAIHFGMDWTEWEGDEAMSARIYWWEMSAVWMEEMMYDDVNDYYGYLPYFYEYPWIGLRNFTSSAPLAFHPYGAVVFPIYLTERWGDSTIVRKIWEQCRDLGVGPQFGEAVDNAVYEVSGGTHRLVDAIREFSVWNMFTGNRADRAPAGLGYSEKEFYPIIPDTAMFVFNDYPFVVTNRNLIDSFSTRLPEIYGTNIIKLEETYLIPDSLGFNFYRSAIHSTLDWNVSLIGFPIDDNADAIVQMNVFEGPNIDQYVITGTEDLFNLMAVITPVLVDVNAYNYSQKFDYAFAVTDTVVSIDSLVYFNFTAPYPNPCLPEGSCNSITFKVEKSFLDAFPPTLLEVTIFNVAGEKICDLQTDAAGNLEMSLDWNLKNESGYDVASGVYLAYWRLSFANDSTNTRNDKTYKSKIAIIR